METESLIELGFTKNQARIYILLLRSPGLSAGKIAKNLSIDRSFTYGIIESLIKKGMIYSGMKKDKKLFYPEKPTRIQENLKEELNKASSIVTLLEKIESSSKNLSSIEIYEGKQALKKYLSELINSKSFLTLGGGGDLNLFNILKYEHPHYLNEIKKRKTSGKVICAEKNKHFWKENLQGSPIELKSLEGAGKENSITIFKDKVILSSETETPNIIIINNPDHAHSLQHYFNYLWKIAKE
jgi:sugar-specific transcriptional regulator TrmB